MFFKSSETNIPRLYVQLIFEKYRSYPAWEPSREVRVGDYGWVSKDNGEFRKKGNLFEDGLADEKSVVKNGKEQEEYCLQTDRARSLHLDGEVGVNLGSVLECDLKKGWKLSKSPCAGLWLVKPVFSYIDDEDALARIIKDNPRLTEFSVVTETYSCPAFALFMQYKAECDFLLGFKFSAPLPMAPAVSPVAGISGRWVNSGSASVFHKGSTDERCFVPLFKLMALRPKDRGVTRLRMRGGEVDDEDPSLTESFPPWGALDEDGNEVQENDMPWL